MCDPAPRVTIDVFLLTLSIPADLPAADADKVRRALDRPTFAARVHAAAADLLARYPTLAPVTVAVSR